MKYMKRILPQFFLQQLLAASLPFLTVSAEERDDGFERDLRQKYERFVNGGKNDEPKNAVSRFLSSTKKKIGQALTKNDEKNTAADESPFSLTFPQNQEESDWLLTEDDAKFKRVSHETTFVNKIKGDSLKNLGYGTPVYCALAGVVSHSGIAVGEKIVHLDGDGNIIMTTPQEFLNRLGGKNPAVNIYYAAYAENKPVEYGFAAARALSQVGRKVKYDAIKKNCHAFTIWCCTGTHQTKILSIKKIDEIIEERCGRDWRWRCWDGWR